MENKLLICGDIHGKLRELVWKLKEQYNLSNTNVIIAGDFGVGFGGPNSMDVLYEKVFKKLEDSNITIYAVRGNHDDPSWFTGERDYERLKFLKDYETININNLDILPIGGAISLDKDWRIKENEKEERKGSNKKYWWPDEDITRLDDISILPKKVDIIVSHEAPKMFQPIILRGNSQTLDSYENVLSDRKYLDTIAEQVNARYWFFGHYHNHYSGSIGQMMYRGLSELELYDVTRLAEIKKLDIVRNSQIIS